MTSIIKNIKDIIHFLVSKDQSNLILDSYHELELAHDYENRFNECLSKHESTQHCDRHDARNAIWLYLRAALRGDKNAQYKLGLSYLNGQLGLDRNYTLAQKWLNQAANHGHSEAKHVLERALTSLALT